MALKITPTKTNLQRLKKKLALAQQGYDLLEQKREVLIQEVLSNITKLKLYMRDIYKKANGAFALYKESVIENGEERIDMFLKTISKVPGIEVTEKSIMGVVIPKLKLRDNVFELTALDFEYNEKVEHTRKAYSDLLEHLVEWAEVYVTMLRLARELKKTHTLVKSLENIVIPQLKHDIVRIQIILEENEREEFIRRKMLKKIK